VSDVKLWKVFSEFIRLRDSIKTTGSKDFFKCCTCGKIKPYAKADAGHFISREFKSIKYDEKNVHAQCRDCNFYGSGQQLEYNDFMIKKYGQEVVDSLKLKRDYEKANPCQIKGFEIEILLKKYKQKVKEFLK